MTEKPILFSGEMVRAILDDRKTQTRRVVKPQPHFVASPNIPFKTIDANPEGIISCHFGSIGDVLWVREMWAYVPATAYRHSTGVQQTINPEDPDMAAVYAAGWERSAPSWKPSIHMPRWACRLRLEIAGVKVERLQDISEKDALAEGLYSSGFAAGVCHPHAQENCRRCGFRILWDSINGKRPGYAWKDNPWVWAITFLKLKGK